MRFAAAVFLAVAVLAPGPARAQPYAFVTGAADDAVGVIDLGRDTLVGRLPVAGLPSGVAYDADQGFLYVARSQAGALERIDTATGARVTVPVGAEPSAVWAEPTAPRFVYVAHGSDDRVSVVGTFGGPPRVLFSYPVGDKPLALTGGGGRLYVANFGDGTVTVIDTVNIALVGVVPVGLNPSALALDVAAGRLYVASLSEDRVRVVDTGTLAVAAAVPVCAAPKGLAVGSGRVYVACFDDGRINVVDTTTATVVADAPSGGGSPVDVRLGPDGQRLYVAHFAIGKSIQVLDAATLVPLAAIEGPAGPLGLAGFSAQAPPVLASRHTSAPVGLLAAGARLARSRLQGEPDPDWRIVDDDLLLFAVQAQTGAVQSIFNLDGGNPTGWRSVRFTGAGTAFLRSNWGTLAYDPNADGPIVSIDASWDRRYIGETGALFNRLALLQGGAVFRSNAQPVTGSAWQPESFVGITENGFSDASGNRPDFSAAGGPIVFGYFVEYTGTSTVTHAIDNLRIRVHRPPPANGHGVLSVSGTASIPPDLATAVAVRRRFGALGAVSARVRLHCPHGTGTAPETVAWADGDAADRVIFISCPAGPDSDGTGFTGRLVLDEPSGGAIVEPNDQLWILVVGNGIGELQNLVNVVVLLFAGLSPTWLVPLVPLAAWLALRRRAAQRRATTHPASAPETRP
jgi:YVTN family beta-propeller protein